MEPGRQDTAAGGVVVRRSRGVFEVCLIRRSRHGRLTWDLPKGHPHAGEGTAAYAVREVREETGVAPRILASLDPLRYQFTDPRDAVPVAKTVSFFLMCPSTPAVSSPDPQEVDAVCWMTMEPALVVLTHQNERRIVEQAQALLQRDAIARQVPEATG